MQSNLEIFHIQAFISIIEADDLPDSQIYVRFQLEEMPEIDICAFDPQNNAHYFNISNGLDFFVRLQCFSAFKVLPAYIYLATPDLQIIYASGYDLSAIVTEAYRKSCQGNHDTETYQVVLELQAPDDQIYGSIHAEFHVEHFSTDLSSMICYEEQMTPILKEEPTEEEDFEYEEPVKVVKKKPKRKLPRVNPRAADLYLLNLKYLNTRKQLINQVRDLENQVKRIETERRKKQYQEKKEKKEKRKQQDDEYSASDYYYSSYSSSKSSAFEDLNESKAYEYSAKPIKTTSNKTKTGKPQTRKQEKVITNQNKINKASAHSSSHKSKQESEREDSVHLSVSSKKGENASDQNDSIDISSSVKLSNHQSDKMSSSNVPNSSKISHHRIESPSFSGFHSSAKSHSSKSKSSSKSMSSGKNQKVSAKNSSEIKEESFTSSSSRRSKSKTKNISQISNKTASTNSGMQVIDSFNGFSTDASGKSQKSKKNSIMAGSSSGKDKKSKTDEIIDEDFPSLTSNKVESISESIEKASLVSGHVKQPESVIDEFESTHSQTPTNIESSSLISHESSKKPQEKAKTSSESSLNDISSISKNDKSRQKKNDLDVSDLSAIVNQLNDDDDDEPGDMSDLNGLTSNLTFSDIKGTNSQPKTESKPKKQVESSSIDVSHVDNTNKVSSQFSTDLKSIISDI